MPTGSGASVGVGVAGGGGTMDCIGAAGDVASVGAAGCAGAPGGVGTSDGADVTGGGWTPPFAGTGGPDAGKVCWMGSGCFFWVIGPCSMTEMLAPLCVVKKARERLVNMNTVANPAVIFPRKLPEPRAPKTLWELPPNAAPMSAPLPF